MTEPIEPALVLLAGKQPGETTSYSVSLSSRLNTGETVSSVTSGPSGTPSGLTFSGISATTTALLFTVAGGVAKRAYYLSATVTTSTGRILVVSMRLYVKDPAA